MMAATDDRAGATGNLPVTTVFRTQITRSRSDSLAWGPGLFLLVGYSWPATSATPIPIVHLQGVDCSQDVDLTRDAEDRLIVNIDLTSGAAPLCASSPALYLIAQATIDADGQSFTGTVASTCRDRSGASPYGWRGIALNPVSAIGARRSRPP